MLPGCSKLVITWKNANDVKIYQHDTIVKLFDLPYFLCQVKLLVQVSSKYHNWFWSYDNFFYKGLTRNPKIGTTPVWVLSNFWRLGQARDANLAVILLMKNYSIQHCNYRFLVIKEKPQEVGKNTFHPD